MTPDQTALASRIRRQGWVNLAYRFLIEVVFLFVAFSQFPDHKWTIGMGLLVFNGAVGSVALMIRQLATGLELHLAQSDRKTRHAIVLAAEQAALGKHDDIDQEKFWRTVEGRLEFELAEEGRYQDKPAGPWQGVGLAVVALLWSVLSSLAGILVVMVLTGG